MQISISRLQLTIALSIFVSAAHAQADCQLLSSIEAQATDDTVVIQQSIDQCAAHGGGVLKLAARTYNISPIQLRNNVYLWLDAGTLLKASSNKNYYARAFIGWPYQPNEALISGYRVSHTGILGAGHIEGQGDTWWDEARRQRKDGTMAKMFPAVPDANGMPRPWLVEFYEASDITIDGPTLQNSPMWNLALRYSNKVLVKNLTIQNPKESPNTDGIDVVSSQDVNIHSARISTGDDNITIKSGLAGFAMPALPASRIDISDVTIGSGHGISIGSETLNGITHVSIDGAHFEGTTNGVRIKTGRDRGADISAIHFANMSMNQVGTALSITAYYPNVPEQRDAPMPDTPTTPRIHDVTFENIQITKASSAGRFIGLPESPLKQLRLTKISIDAEHGLILRDAILDAQNLDIHTRQGKAIDTQEQGQLILH